MRLELSSASPRQQGCLFAKEQASLKGHRETLVVLSIALSSSVVVLQNSVMECWSCLACAKSSAAICSIKRSCYHFYLKVLGFAAPKLEKSAKGKEIRVVLLRPWLSKPSSQTIVWFVPSLCF